MSHPPTNDATSLLLHLEEYLGRLVDLVDGGSGSPTTRSSRAAAPEVSAPAPALWLAGQPPDTSLRFEPSSSTVAQPAPTVHFGQPSAGAAPPLPQQQPAPTQGAAAEKFLKDLEQLIKTFLSQQQLDNSRAAAPTTMTTTYQPETTTTPALSREAEARAEVLRKAVAAADADAAARELRSRSFTGATSSQPPSTTTRPMLQTNHSILQQIDNQWDATLAENNSLKAQLGQANHQQERLLHAKHSTEKLLKEKEILLSKIRDVILDLRNELAHHKLQLEQQAVAASARSAPVMAPVQDDKQSMINQLRGAIVDLESRLHHIQGEKKGLEDDLFATHREKRGLESQLNHIQGEKLGLEADLQRTHEALRTHQSLKNTLEKSFQNAETEVQALRGLLKQLEPGSNGTAPVGGVAPSTASSRLAPPPSSAFQPAFRTSTAPPIRSYPVVETVYNEPPPNVDGIFGSKYDFQQHQAPWQESSSPPKQHSWEATTQKSVWEGPPKPPQQHIWEPIHKPDNNTTTLYHVDVPPPPRDSVLTKEDPQGHGNSPEWTQPVVSQNQQGAAGTGEKEQQQCKHHWNYDPPAEYASVGGDSPLPQPPTAKQQQQWSRVDPAAVDGTGSNAYSSGAGSVSGVESRLESIDGASYYGSSAPPQQQHQQHQERNLYNYDAAQTWHSNDEPQQHVWSDYHERTQHQEPPLTISTAPPAVIEPKQQIGRMAFLQEQMANAVEDARNNPNTRTQQQQQRSVRSHQPTVKVPLQPPPPGPARASPERSVPPTPRIQNTWSAHVPVVSQEYKPHPGPSTVTPLRPAALKPNNTTTSPWR